MMDVRDTFDEAAASYFHHCIDFLSSASFPFRFLSDLHKMSHQQMWLATVPNRGENPSALFSNMQKQMSNCKLHRFEIPSLVVGTLDSLMALSDDLNRINQQVEVCSCCIIILTLDLFIDSFH